MHGKTEQAQQELQKALAKDPYLYEARYRQIALLAKEDNEKKVLTQLQTLIRDDRRVYLQVMLDPAFAPLQDKIHPMLSTLFQEARTEAIEQMNRVTEALNTLREWSLHPEGELTAMEHSLDRMRQHIKGDSYFGYRDAAHEGTILQAKIPQLTGQRRSHLQRDFTATLASVQVRLTACASFTQARQAPMATQLAKYQHELTRLQSQTSFSEPRQFWQAWKALQKLQTAVQELLPTPQRQASTGPKEKWRLLTLSLFGVGGSILVDSALFAILGYLTYASGLRLPEGQLLLFMACGAFGGMLLGSTVGWLVHWYRSRS
jgi:hypothetical protein